MSVQSSTHCGWCSQRERWWKFCHCPCHKRAETPIHRVLKEESYR